MKLIADKRRTGKTTKLVEMVKTQRIERRKDSSDTILVVINENRKKQIMEEFDLGYHEVETYNTITKHYYEPTLRTKKLLLDDVDMFISTLFHTKILAAAWSLEGDTPDNEK